MSVAGRGEPDRLPERQDEGRGPQRHARRAARDCRRRGDRLQPPLRQPTHTPSWPSVSRDSARRETSASRRSATTACGWAGEGAAGVDRHAFTIASRTSRVTLGTSALILPLRKTVRFATTGRRSTRTLPTSVLAPEARNSAARSTRWSSRWPACPTTSATMWTSRSCCSDICGHGQRSRTAASSTRLGRLCGGALVIGIHGVRFCGRHPRTPQKSSAVNARTLAAETISSMRM